MTGDFRVAVSQISGICMIYGPLITFACHRVLKNGYLTTQFHKYYPVYILGVHLMFSSN